MTATVNRPQDTLYYDGACGMCTRTTGILGKLDWLSRLEFRDMIKVPIEDWMKCRSRWSRPCSASR